jgi:MmyB-like transcription regulator ligand binding domain
MCWSTTTRCVLFDDWPVRDDAPNLLRYIFLDPAASGLVVDWEQCARRVVAEFRTDAGAHLDEDDVVALLNTLLQRSTVFAHWWTRYAVIEREGGVREF